MGGLAGKPCYKDCALRRRDPGGTRARCWLSSSIHVDVCGMPPPSGILMHMARAPSPPPASPLSISMPYARMSLLFWACQLGVRDAHGISGLTLLIWGISGERIRRREVMARCDRGKTRRAQRRPLYAVCCAPFAVSAFNCGFRLLGHQGVLCCAVLGCCGCRICAPRQVVLSYLRVRTPALVSGDFRDGQVDICAYYVPGLIGEPPGCAVGRRGGAGGHYVPRRHCPLEENGLKKMDWYARRHRGDEC